MGWGLNRGKVGISRDIRRLLGGSIGWLASQKDCNSSREVSWATSTCDGGVVSVVMSEMGRVSYIGETCWGRGHIDISLIRPHRVSVVLRVVTGGRGGVVGPP